MQVPTPTTFAPSPVSLTEDVLAIPASHGIYALTTPGNPPHISWSINLRRRLNRLLVPSYTASSGNLSPLAEKVTSVSYWRVSSRLETSLILYELTREFYPDSYLRRLHLRLPWFVGVVQTDTFGRTEVSSRPGRRHSQWFGPFRSRDAAQVYEEQVLALHQIRRCTETLAPSPDHPGCIYGEMNQCLRPCQCAVSAQEYGSETQRLADFLTSSGKSALHALAAARDRAAAQMDFEQAALTHKRVEKIRAAAAFRDNVVTAVDGFHGVALTSASDPEAVNLWPMFAGYWQPPITIVLRQETRSLDSMLRESLTAAFAKPSAQGNRSEQVALFSRWYYSTWRDGAWFPFQTLEKFNYRRLVKAISDLLKPAVKGP